MAAIKYFVKCSHCGHVTPIREGRKAHCDTITSDNVCPHKDASKLTVTLDGCGCIGEHTERCKTYCGPA